MKDLLWDEIGYPAKQTAVRKVRVRRKLTNQQKAGRATAKIQKRRYGVAA